MSWFLSHWHHLGFTMLLCTGLYIVISRDNLVKKLMLSLIHI